MGLGLKIPEGVPGFPEPGASEDGIPQTAATAGEWLGPLGYHLEGLPCGGLTRVAANCEDGQAVPEITQGRYLIGPDSFPFVISAGLRCSLMSGDTDLARWHADTDALLDLCMWGDIANELWTGAVAQDAGWDNRYLASDDATVVGDGDPLHPVAGIAGLEEAIGGCACGDPTVLHVPLKAVPFLASHGQIVQQGDRLFTYNGSLVIADRGYPGTAPGGGDPDEGTVWIYGTSVLWAGLGPVEHPQSTVRQTVDFTTNDQEVRSERRAAISWLCCHYAAQIALTPGSDV